ncbi:Spo0E like sporulation regulatory protein [compost metagenome]
MNNAELIQKMERERQELHELVGIYGFQHPSVISKSVQLDQTLNFFQLQRKTQKESRLYSSTGDFRGELLEDSPRDYTIAASGSGNSREPQTHSRKD